jgi:hypothetical protein
MGFGFEGVFIWNPWMDNILHFFGILFPKNRTSPGQIPKPEDVIYITTPIASDWMF